MCVAAMVTGGAADVVAQGLGAKVVFAGNSICAIWPKSDPDLFAPGMVINTGVGGETSRQILARFDKDVIRKGPDIVVIISPLTNDIAQNEGPVTQQQMVDNVEEMIRMSQAAGAVTLLANNLPCAYFFWKPDMHPEKEFVEVNSKLRELAAANNCEYIDLHTLLRDDNDAFNPLYTYDGCHPNADGFAEMRQAIMPRVEAAITTLSVQITENDIKVGDAGYYRLDGTPVGNPGHGLYIKVDGGKASKVYL